MYSKSKTKINDDNDIFCMGELEQTIEISESESANERVFI